MTVFTSPPRAAPKPEVDAVRKAMRATAIARRNLQNSSTIAAWNTRLLERLAEAWPSAPGKIIGFCWPMQNEPDLRQQVLRWCQPGIHAVLPVVVAAGEPLVFRPWPQASAPGSGADGAAMVPDRYGIPTPDSGPEMRPDVLLLPLNAFDEAGYRIGYGGGFFDRTLAALRDSGSPPLSIGVGFEIGAVADTFPQAHDVRLDWIVTEARTLRCP